MLKSYDGYLFCDQASLTHISNRRFGSQKMKDTLSPSVGRESLTETTHENTEEDTLHCTESETGETLGVNKAPPITKCSDEFPMKRMPSSQYVKVDNRHIGLPITKSAPSQKKEDPEMANQVSERIWCTSSNVLQTSDVLFSLTPLPLRIILRKTTNQTWERISF